MLRCPTTISRSEGRGRVFANANRTEVVAAVFSGSWTMDEFAGELRPETPPGPMWSYTIPIQGCFGADGRVVSYSCSDAGGCQWANDEKLSWLELAPSVLDLIDTPTVALSLSQLAAPAGPAAVNAGDKQVARAGRPSPAPPVILQMAYDNFTTGVDHVQQSFGSALAYTVPNGTAGAHRLTLLLHNLHKSAGGAVGLVVAVGAGTHHTKAGQAPVAIAINRTLDVGNGRGVVPVPLVIDLTTGTAQGTMHVVTATATGTWGRPGTAAWEERLSMLFEVR